MQRARVLSSELRGRKVGPCVVRLSQRWRFEPPRFGARASVTLALRFSARLALASARPPSKPAMPASPSKPYGERQGWVYLGEYSGGRWRTRYFKIAAGTEPAKLAGRTLASIGRCNVRSAPPSVVGIMGRVVGGLPAGSKVAVTRVQRWLDSGFIWARVRAH